MTPDLEMDRANSGFGAS